MLTLPDPIMAVLTPFAKAFNYRIWDMVQILVVGAILTPGRRTVTAILRTMGLQEEACFQNYHRVLNRAKWSGLEMSKILLGLLVAAFCVAGVALVIGADDTIERRKGEKIRQKGVFRDPVRSSHKHMVYTFGLRWMSMMVLVPVPWTERIWALPFLTVLAPSKKTNAAKGKRHKTTIDWIMQMISAVRRWHSERAIILVTDGGLCAVKLGLRCGNLPNPVTWVSRLRLDAALYDWPGPQPDSKPGPKPKKGERQPSLQGRLDDAQTVWQPLSIAWYGGKNKDLEIVTGTNLWYTPGFDPLPIRWVLVRDPAGKFKPTAFVCTDLQATAEQILRWFILRWGVEVTFQESRIHLRLETQRQWSDLAIARTTPALLALFSLISLFVFQIIGHQPLPVRTAAWYTKPEPTFSDAIAFVRFYLWTNMESTHSPVKTTFGLFPNSIWASLVDSICYAT
ncbi:MAG: transposase [Caldilineaceae bacterium]|nr:transposase [Caldilineaceae bacterium]